MRRAMRCEAIDEWRRHCARKRAHLFDCVSLDAYAPEIAEMMVHEGQCVHGLDPSSEAARMGAKEDVRYLFRCLAATNRKRELRIAWMIYLGYSHRSIARRLNRSISTFEEIILPRWQGLCQTILGH